MNTPVVNSLLLKHGSLCHLILFWTLTLAGQAGAFAQGSLTNGAKHQGNIAAAGGADSWTFSANAGDSIMLRAGAATLTPRIRLFAPDNIQVAEANPNNSTFNRDAVLTYRALTSGTYTVLISAAFPAQTGAYDLYLAQAPGTFVVSSGDEGGDLNNGAANSGTITVGDLDLWRFTANAGEGLMLRVGATNFTPWIRLYGPDGALAGEANFNNSTFNRDTFLNLQATNSGVYTVVLSATFAGQSGTYGLHLAQAAETFVVSPGDEGGDLNNGAANSGSIALGDLDLWRFTANAGEGVMLRVGATNFTPWIRLYGPDGALAGEANFNNSTFNRDTFLNLQATNTGLYTVVLSATFAGQSGTYGLHLAQAPETFVVSPGDEGGDLNNGTANAGAIALGDLDLWRFTAAAGAGVMLRVGATNFTPWIRLYGPDGALAGEATFNNSTFNRDTFLNLKATNSGIYTVVVSATFPGQSGTYGSTLALAPAPIVLTPGDEGGSLINGNTNTATLNLGDLDVWSFLGTPGDSNVLRVVATGFTPWIRLYSSTGELVGEANPNNSTFNRTATLIHEVTTANPGLYTVVVGATFPGQSGTYTFKQSRWAPDLIVPETQTIDEGATLKVSISAQDPDDPLKPLPFKLISAPPEMTLALASSTNAMLTWATTEAHGPVTNVVVATVTDVVNGRTFVRTNSFTVVVNEINTPPQLTVPTDQVIDELTPLTVSAAATDIDLPANPLTFSLVSPPEGMKINPDTGAISWTPSEAQGPSVNMITVVVTDSSPSAANAIHLSATNTFAVTVREVNLPPNLAPIPDQTINEGAPLVITPVISDADLPPNALAFTLLSAPLPGLTLNPATGVISWTPSEAEGPATNVVTFKVQDNGAPSLSVTNSFTVIVKEVNAAPILPAQSDRTINELTTLTVANTATDSDLPANALTYALVLAPPNAAIDSNGVITWAPGEAQGASTNIFTTIVTDSGVPNLTATNSFTVVVNEVNTAPVLQSIPDKSLHYGTPLALQAMASDTDLPANTLSYSLDQPPTGMTIDAGTGAIAWTPLQAQVGNYSVTVRVADNGTPSLSATTTFQIAVTGEGSQLSISQLPGGLMQLRITGDVGLNYELQESSDLVKWQPLLEFRLAASPFNQIDPDSANKPLRFYRLLLKDQ